MRPRFFTPSEVAVHNTAEDLWVSLLGRVLDLTPLAQRHKGRTEQVTRSAAPLLESAGKDISEVKSVLQVLRFIDPQTQCRRYYTPRGRFLHVPPPGPAQTGPVSSAPLVERLTLQHRPVIPETRFIRVINTLTSQEQSLEETLQEILAGPVHNSHGLNNNHSYTWKHAGENGLHDDDLECLPRGGPDRRCGFTSQYNKTDDFRF
uniref:Cytochrome b5 domain-containing protein 1 n=1 Tax=Neogobius melanostomus TaxID=47308 RepID=A0A8C6WHT4_9GOBI